jgi:hypothetical protein
MPKARMPYSHRTMKRASIKSAPVLRDSKKNEVFSPTHVYVNPKKANRNVHIMPIVKFNPWNLLFGLDLCIQNQLDPSPWYFPTWKPACTCNTVILPCMQG